MTKRAAAALFWFVAITWAYNYVGFYLGTPPLIGPLAAAAVSAFVGLDPLHAVWSQGAKAPRSETLAHGAAASGVMGVI
jgi:hypothetical protein